MLTIPRHRTCFVVKLFLIVQYEKQWEGWAHDTPVEELGAAVAKMVLNEFNHDVAKSIATPVSTDTPAAPTEDVIERARSKTWPSLSRKETAIIFADLPPKITQVSHCAQRTCTLLRYFVFSRFHLLSATDRFPSSSALVLLVLTRWNFLEISCLQYTPW